MNLDHFKKTRILERFQDEEDFFNNGDGQATTTEARNAKANASSRMPFSEYRQQLMHLTENEENDVNLPQFTSTKKSSKMRTTHNKGNISFKNNLHSEGLHRTLDSDET
jgi:hypothetical protein